MQRNPSNQPPSSNQPPLPPEVQPPLLVVLTPPNMCTPQHLVMSHGCLD